MIYRITGRVTWYDPETRQRVASDERVTVKRSHKDTAYYEDLQHARRGLIGLRAGNGYYTDFRIESNAGAWEPLTSEE